MGGEGMLCIRLVSETALRGEIGDSTGDMNLSDAVQDAQPG